MKAKLNDFKSMAFAMLTAVTVAIAATAIFSMPGIGFHRWPVRMLGSASVAATGIGLFAYLVCVLVLGITSWQEVRFRIMCGFTRSRALRRDWLMILALSALASVLMAIISLPYTIISGTAWAMVDSVLCAFFGGLATYLAGQALGSLNLLFERLVVKVPVLIVTGLIAFNAIGGLMAGSLYGWGGRNILIAVLISLISALVSTLTFLVGRSRLGSTSAS